MTHTTGARGNQLLGGVLVGIDNLFLDGDGDFFFHLAAHFGGHKFGGIEVDGSG